MSKRPRRPKKSSKRGPIVLFITIAIGLLVWFAMTSTIKAPPTSPSKMPVTAVAYSEAEMKQFWADHLEVPIHQQLTGGMHPLLEIREHFNFLFAEILKRYGRPLRLEVSMIYNQYSRNAGGSTDATGGDPRVILFLPTIMDDLRILKVAHPDDFEQRFVNQAVATFLHEAEHLAHGVIDNRKLDRQALLQNEATAWADTSAHVLAVFVKYGYKLSLGNEKSYQDWVRCGQVNNACWIKAIEYHYAEVMK